MIRPGVRRLFRLPLSDVARRDAEVDEEIRLHLEMRTRQLIERGMDAESAHEEALRRFGPVPASRRALRREATRRESHLRLRERVASIGQDLRWTIRGYGRTPAFAALAVATLALGIGVTTAVFSLANHVLLKPVPGVADPDRLVRVEMREPGGDGATGLSPVNMFDLARGTPALSGLAGMAPLAAIVESEGATPIHVRGDAVAGDLFGVLGVRPHAGRLISAEEATSTEPIMVAVVSHAFANSFLGSSSEAVGRQIRINTFPFTVVGVAPEGFHGPQRLGDSDVWVPASVYGLTRHFPEADLTARDRGSLMQMVGRLAPGAFPEVAEGQLRAAMTSLVESYPDENEKYAHYQPTVFPGIGLSLHVQEQAVETVALMMGIVAILLLISCSNVANLLLLRGVHRRGETAVRRALGASTGRVVQSHLVEGSVLGLAGCGVGAILAVWITRLFQGQSFVWLPPLDDIPLDWRVLAFAAALSLAAGVVFGLIPAWVTSRDDYVTHLKEGARTVTTSSARLRRALTVAQIAAALVLVVGAGLLARTLHSLTQVDLGLDTEVMAFGVNALSLGYSDERNAALRDALLERVRAIPAVESAALTSSHPFSGSLFKVRLQASEDPESPPREALNYAISDKFFGTLGIPIIAGRGELRPGEIIVNEPFASRFLGEGSPIGRELVERTYAGTARHTVVGVVGGTRVQDLRGAEDPVTYVPFVSSDGWLTSTPTILVSSPLPPYEVESLVRDAVREVDPSLPFYRVEAITEGVRRFMWEERLLGRLISVLALLSTGLAAIGLYAVVSYTTAQRTREIGIRVALGAPARAVLRMVGRETAGLAAVGITLGLLGAAWLSRILENKLFGVGRLDPVTYAVAVGVFVLVVVAASWRPARAALRTDPVVALRHE